MASPSDWYEQYLRQQEQERLRGEALGAFLMPALAFLGVTRVTVGFDGYGDDGEIQDPEVQLVPAAGLPEGLLQRIEEVCESQIPGGWEINAGSFGKITFDVPAGRVQVEQTWREEEDETGDDDLDEE